MKAQVRQFLQAAFGLRSQDHPMKACTLVSSADAPIFVDCQPTCKNVACIEIDACSFRDVCNMAAAPSLPLQSVSAVTPHRTPVTPFGTDPSKLCDYVASQCERQQALNVTTLCVEKKPTRGLCRAVRQACQRNDTQFCQAARVLCD
jgi:hypothetical protein